MENYPASFVVYFKEKGDKLTNGGEPPRGKLLYAVRALDEYPDHPSAKPYPCIIGEFRYASDYHVNQMEISNPKQRGIFCIPIKLSAVNKPESLLTVDDIIWSKIVSAHARYYADTAQTAYTMCDLFQSRLALDYLEHTAKTLTDIQHRIPVDSQYYNKLTAICHNAKNLMDDIKQMQNMIYET